MTSAGADAAVRRWLIISVTFREKRKDQWDSVDLQSDYSVWSEDLLHVAHCFCLVKYFYTVL